MCYGQEDQTPVPQLPSYIKENVLRTRRTNTRTSTPPVTLRKMCCGQEDQTPVPQLLQLH